MKFRYFQLKENNTNVKTEFVAGLTTFMTMAYILIVNPLILSEAGMDKGSVFTATIIASVIATTIMALWAKLPFALAPGMGLNAYFAYTIVLGMGYSWQFAITAVFIEGLLFILFTILNIREAIIDGIPADIKKAISVGIGLFIAFIGLSNAGIIEQGKGTPLTLGNIADIDAPLLAIAGILITGVLFSLKIKGALLIGIVITTIIGIPMGVTSLPNGFVPVSLPPSVSPTFFQFNFHEIFTYDFLIVLFVLLFVDMFDTVGTLIGVTTKAGIMQNDGKLPRAKQALFADSIGTTIGAIFGTSTVTTYIESATGIAEGGKTGLTTLFTAAFFLIALFLAPVFAIIPQAATATALVIVGLFMMSPVADINFKDFTTSIPAFFTILMMPLAYSIADGIVFGIVSYVILKTFTGKYRQVSLIMYILSLVFIAKYIVAV